MRSPAAGEPIVFAPRGLYDALDGTFAPEGACSALTNLVHDVTTMRLWVPRPGVTQLTDFTGFTTPGVVSAMIAVGTRVYGMIGTQRYPNKDEPFCYDTATSAFVAIGTVTNANTPTTQATSGGWTPPTMALIGTYIIVTHPGFDGTGTNFFGAINIANPAALLWTDQNTGTNALPAVPKAVAQFNNRAWYVVNNALYYSDVLAPLTLTTGTQIVTLGDSGTAITVLGSQGFPQQTGGIAQALLAWKSNQGAWQIKGDAATVGGSDLTVAGPSGGVGCSAPRSVALTPAGNFFMALDGIRIIKDDGTISDKPVPGVRQPFGAAVLPSRVVAAYGETVYRICGTWTLPSGQAKVDYWYDFEINEWSGPHSFPYDCAVAINAGFAVASNDYPGKLFYSTTVPSASDTYTEAGVAMSFTMTSAILPQRDMQVQAVVESTVDLAFIAGVSGTYTIQMLDPGGSVLGQASISAPSGGTIWGAFTWGAASWAGLNTGLQTYNIDWTAPVVYKRGQPSITGTPFLGLRIGAIRMRTEPQGYLNLQNPP